jgi:two-component system, OmpR family, sensor histidine kinase KdpD
MFEANPSSVLPYRPVRLFGPRRNASQSALPSSAEHSSFLSHVAVQAGLHVAGLAIIALIVVFYRHVVFVNETVVGFSFLLAVLCASAVWGLSVAAVMSIAAAIGYDYFFLPPVGTFNISDTRDWVALCSFLVTAGIGSYLSAWARREARTANQRRRETEQLYTFSQHLLGAGDPRQVFETIPRYVFETFATGPVLLYLADGNHLYSVGLDHDQLGHDPSAVQVAHEALQANAEQNTHVVPLRAGEQELGSLRIVGPVPSPTALEALGALAVVAIERARAIERAAKMEAARESEHLKSVLLDAIAHDFKTPLTSIKGSATALLADLDFGHEERKELLLLIDEECDRINKLIGSASEMSRLDAGHIKLNLAPRSVGELIAASLADCQGVLRERRIDLEEKDRECLVLVDLPLASKVLVHLIENANLYSAPGEPIVVRAQKQDGRVLFSVSDRGPGIEETELGHIFEKFYRGKGQRDRVDGPGMGLAIAAAIVRAHGGAIDATSQPGKGSIFTFSLPIPAAH